jgi:autotransporter passenger strand-loop-strand repeat protein
MTRQEIVVKKGEKLNAGGDTLHISNASIEVQGSTFNLFLIDCSMNITNGGNAAYTTFNNSGQQYVGVGSEADATEFETANGKQIVLGDAEYTTFHGGEQILDGHGTAGDTLFFDGNQSIGANATAFYTTFHAGKQVDQGHAYYTILYGGEQLVENNGEAVATTLVDQGHQLVQELSIAFDTNINGDGVQVIAAAAGAGNTTINSGQESVFGIVADTTVHGGLQCVQSGGLARNTTIAGGEMKLVDGAKVIDGINFAGIGTLTIDKPITGNEVFANSLVKIGGGDSIDLKGLAYHAENVAVVSGSQLKISNGSASETFTLVTPLTTKFFLFDDGNGGTLVRAGGHVVTDIPITKANSEIYSLFQTAYTRAPTEAEFRLCVSKHDQGASVSQIASAFIDTQEFSDKFGANLSNNDFVISLYKNVLGRQPDFSGMKFWLDNLNSGHLTRGGELVAFTDNVQITGQNIEHGYFLT